MTGYKYVAVITDREYGEDFENFLKRHGVSRVMETFANLTFWILSDCKKPKKSYFGLSLTAKKPRR